MSKDNLFKELITRNILSVRDNRVQILNNIDITMYGSRAWAFTLQEIGKIKGQEYLYDLGYMMGSDAAAEILETITKKKHQIPSVLNDMQNIIEITGFGIINFSEDDGIIKIIVEMNHILDYAKGMYGDKAMAASFYCGIYNAFVNVINGTDLKLKIESDISKGDEKTVFSA